MFVVWVRGIYIISITKGAGRRSTRRHPEISKNRQRQPELAYFYSVKMLGASSYGEQPSNAFTWQHALISLREISICVSLLLAFYCKCQT